MLQQNHGDIDNIWKIIKQVKKISLIGNVDPKCQESFHLIVEDEIKKNNNNVEEYFTTNSVDYDSHETIAEDILQTGAEMFTYLNFCPPQLLQFYKKLLLKRSTKDIILAITNVIKTRRNAITVLQFLVTSPPLPDQVPPQLLSLTI